PHVPGVNALNVVHGFLDAAALQEVAVSRVQWLLLDLPANVNVPVAVNERIPHSVSSINAALQLRGPPKIVKERGENGGVLRGRIRRERANNKLSVLIGHERNDRVNRGEGDVDVDDIHRLILAPFPASLVFVLGYRLPPRVLSPHPTVVHALHVTVTRRLKLALHFLGELLAYLIVLRISDSSGQVRSPPLELPTASATSQPHHARHPGRHKQKGHWCQLRKPPNTQDTAAARTPHSPLLASLYFLLPLSSGPAAGAYLAAFLFCGRGSGRPAARILAYISFT